MTDLATDPDESTTTDGDEQPAPATDAAREAAKYRRQLRDTETQRDALTATVEAMQQAEVIRLVRDEHGLQKPAALWAAGVTLAELLADDGTVDADLVKAATDRAVAELGLTVGRPPDLSLDAGPRTSVPMSGPSWHTAITGGRRNM